MHVIENKALMFVTKRADQITQLIPKSKIIERNGELARVLVNWGHEETKILKNLRIKDVPHPILGRYDWPGVYTPFEHQRSTAAFLAEHPRAYVLSEAGTGKTSAAAWAADYLMNKGEVKRALVVCPVSIMDTAWRSDLFKTIMHRKVGIATGTKRRREEIISGDYEFVIINFDGVKVAHEALKKGGFDLFIVDEATYVKSVTTDRWKALNSIIKPTDRVWAMTGTPASQAPTDAYGLARLVKPTSVPQFFGRFRDSVMIKVTAFKWVPRNDAKDTVFKLLQPAIRYTKEECLDLPDMLYTTREVPLTKQQEHYYEQVRKQMVAIAAGEEITAVNAAGLMNRLLQISAGASYTSEGGVVDFDITNRLNVLLEVINATDKKVLVFVPFRHVLSRLEDELAKAGITSRSIHGGVTASERAEAIKAFQSEDDPRVMLAQPAATAHGITLTRADTVVWWGPVASAELYLQGNSRAHRAGQTNKVTVVRLQGSSVERRIYNLLDNKVDLHSALVELYKEEALDTKI